MITISLLFGQKSLLTDSSFYVSDDNLIISFGEKSTDDGSKINAGYMVLESEVYDFIKGDETIFKREPMEQLVRLGQLAAYKFDGYWQYMDTKREKEKLEAL